MYLVRGNKNELERIKRSQNQNQNQTFHFDYNEELKQIWRENVRNTDSKVICEIAGLQPLHEWLNLKGQGKKGAR